MTGFQVEDSRVLVNSPIMTVRQDLVAMPDGTKAKREIVEHFGAVAIAALQDGKITLIQQYRHSVGQHLWELPAGLLDVADEPPLQAAQRELQEEVGLAAKRYAHVVDVLSSPGFCDEAVRVYAAFDTFEVERPTPEAEEADARIATFELAEAVAMVLRGEILNSTAIAGILSLNQRLQDPHFMEQAVEVPAPGADTQSCDGKGPADVGPAFNLRPTKLAKRRLAAGLRGDLKQINHD